MRVVSVADTHGADVVIFDDDVVDGCFRAAYIVARHVVLPTSFARWETTCLVRAKRANKLPQSESTDPIGSNDSLCVVQYTLYPHGGIKYTYLHKMWLLLKVPDTHFKAFDSQRGRSIYIHGTILRKGTITLTHLYSLRIIPLEVY
jgi:hypothetical protein